MSFQVTDSTAKTMESINSKIMDFLQPNPGEYQVVFQFQSTVQNFRRSWNFQIIYWQVSSYCSPEFSFHKTALSIKH